MIDYQLVYKDYSDGRRGEFGERNGKNHGPWRTFYANGHPHIERTFMNGREHGTSRIWNEKGQLVDEKQYQDGALHGRWRIWDETGELKQDCIFKFGNKAIKEGVSTARSCGSIERLLSSFRELTSEESADRYVDALSALSLRSVQVAVNNKSPQHSAVSSCIGTVTHLPVNTNWPAVDGNPMVPLVQIAVSELPHIPDCLKDISFIAIFGPPSFPFRDGVDELKIFTATSIDSLVPTVVPVESLRRTPSGVDFTIAEMEFPDGNDLPPGLKAYIEDNVPNSPIIESTCEAKTKIGGWPAWIQFSRLDGFGDLVMQIDSCDFEGWDAGDATVFYCFRRPDTGEIWTFSEMC